MTMKLRCEKKSQGWSLPSSTSIISFPKLRPRKESSRELQEKLSIMPSRGSMGHFFFMARHPLEKLTRALDKTLQNNRKGEYCRGSSIKSLRGFSKVQSTFNAIWKCQWYRYTTKKSRICWARQKRTSKFGPTRAKGYFLKVSLKNISYQRKNLAFILLKASKTGRSAWPRWTLSHQDLIWWWL